MYDMDARLPAHLAALFLRVSPQLINYWRSSGLLTPIDRRGRSPRYRLGDLIAVEANARRHPQSRRAG